MSSPNIPFLIKFNTDLLVGIVCRKDPVKNPPLVVAVAQAIVTSAAENDATAAMEALEALATGTTDPATIAEIQTVVAFVSAKATGLQSLFAGSVTADLALQFLTDAAQEAVNVASAYLPTKTS